MNGVREIEIDLEIDIDAYNCTCGTGNGPKGARAVGNMHKRPCNHQNNNILNVENNSRWLRTVI